MTLVLTFLEIPRARVQACTNASLQLLELPALRQSHGESKAELGQSQHIHKLTGDVHHDPELVPCLSEHLRFTSPSTSPRHHPINHATCTSLFPPLLRQLDPPRSSLPRASERFFSIYQSRNQPCPSFSTATHPTFNSSRRASNRSWTSPTPKMARQKSQHCAEQRWS